MSKQVPESVSFGFKILEIPTLEEVGVPLAGLCLTERHATLKGGGYEACWIDRGDPLLRYRVRFYQNLEKNWLSMFWDPTHEESFEVASPISGLLLLLRQEYTLGFLGSLQYEWSQERLLPVMLVPEDEPLPDLIDLHVFDQIASVLSRHFDVLPYRDRSRTRPERLRDWLGRQSKETAARYQEWRIQLQERENGSFNAYNIRELNESDRKVLSHVQILRGKDHTLREKLVHISRGFGESI